MEVLVYPIKQLYKVMQQPPENAVAVISSAYEVDEERLTVPYIAEIYEDLDMEVPGRSLSREAAKRMAQFIRSIPKATQIVLCACNAGQRRSTAVAAATRLYFGMNDLPVWENPAYQPNPWVFTLLCEALDIEMTDEMLDFRMETNHYAFRKALGKC